MAESNPTIAVRTDEKVVEIPFTLSQKLRGHLVAGRHQSVARRFATNKASPIVLDTSAKRAVLRAVVVMMKEGNDERARQLFELRNALRADLDG